MAREGKALVIDKPYLLLCEGEDEVNFFGAWLRDLKMTNVLVISYQGKTKLGEMLGDLSKARGFERVTRIAITRDADEDAQAARQSMEQIVVTSPVASLEPKLFVLPDDEHPGALETLWLNLLDEQPYSKCVDKFFDFIEQNGWRPSVTWAKNDKARAQLWIATKDVPNERFGIAAWHGRRDLEKPWMRERWVDFNHRAFLKLREFLASSFQ